MSTRTGGNSGSSFCMALGRILSSLMLTVLIVMPLTEYVWHFDGFLSGGQDFEFGLLAALAFFGLVLVLLQRGRQALRLLMSLRISCAFKFPKVGPRARGSRSGRIVSSHGIPPLSLALTMYTLPIRV